MYRIRVLATLLLRFVLGPIVAIVLIVPIAIGIGIGTFEAGAQTANPATVERVDSITWQLYQAGDWDGVLRETRAALREGIALDGYRGYYLRVRAGKAAYEKKQYRLAAHHFEKATRQNPYDDFVNYWYYYSLVLDGRSDEADALFAAMGTATTQRLGLAPRAGVSSVLAEAQYSANRDAEALSDFGLGTPLTPSPIPQNVGTTAYLTYRGVYREQTYKAVGLDHRVTPSFHLFHGLSHLGIQRTHIFQPINGNALEWEDKASQVQYFLQGRFRLSPRMSLQASATLLGGYSDGALYSVNSGGIATLYPSRYNIGDRQASVSLTTSGTWLEPTLGFTVGRVGGYTQQQAMARLTVYPLRNANLSVATQFDMHHDGSDGLWKPILQQHVTLKTGPVWWIAEAASGDMRNFTTLDGYVVYNQPETIRQVKGLSLYVPLIGYKLGVTLRYRLLEKEGMDFDYSTQDTYTTRPYRYNDDSYLVSVRWNL